MFRGKKYQDSAKQIDKANLYDTAEAMDLIVKTAPRQVRRDRRAPREAGC